MKSTEPFLSQPTHAPPSQSVESPVGGRPSRFERWSIVLFVGLNLLLPFVVGEMYPITISPMFCDQPTTYCEFEVTNIKGDSLPLDQFELQRVYDGNPTGLGVGIEPPTTFDQFGKVPTPAALQEHVQAQLKREINANVGPVNVRCRVYGAIDSQRVGELEEQSFEVSVSPDELSP